jgi:uncharacterized protein YndB with AHSA1/START domain
MAHFTLESTINAPREKVFAVLADPTLIPRWRTDVPGITNVSGAGDRMTFTEEVRFMGKKELQMKVTQYSPPTSLRIVAMNGMSILPTQSFELWGEGGKTKVVLSVDLRISGPMKLFAPLFPTQFRKIWTGYFQNLERYLQQ